MELNFFMVAEVTGFEEEYSASKLIIVVCL
jgi:hypothetical protein